MSFRKILEATNEATSTTAVTMTAEDKAQFERAKQEFRAGYEAKQAAAEAQRLSNMRADAKYYNSKYNKYDGCGTVMYSTRPAHKETASRTAAPTSSIRATK